MPIFNSQFANVAEWNEYRDDLIFWKWNNKELKKGSRLVVRPGQDAIFLYNGRIEGIFKDEGSYEVESQIIPFLSTLKGFKFGFNSGLRAEVLFVNVKEFTVKWGTKNAVLIPADGLPGGLPIRAFGTFTMKVSDYIALVDKVAGIKTQYSVDDVRERVLSVLDSLLLKWIPRKGGNMFNLQESAAEIAASIREDLDMELFKIGLSVTGFSISSLTYPEEIQKKINQSASYSMVGDVERYKQIGVIDAMSEGKGGGRAMSDAMGAAMGMMAGINAANQMNVPNQSASADTKFCSECGKKIPRASKFCPECGAKLN